MSSVSANLDTTFGEVFNGAGSARISFEVFPPRNDAAYATLMQILPELVELKPDFMTVTYGAFGSTQGRTLEIAALIRDRFKLPSACHLTCVGSSRDDLHRILDEIAAAGVKNIVALRGDPPQGQASFTPPVDGLAHASDLVALIRSREFAGKSRFGIAVAGYPEKHIEAPDLGADLVHLRDKVAKGADAVVTQLFYDNADYWAFLKKARDLGVKVPIVPGLMPILSGKQIVKITSMCGSGIPAALRAELDEAGEDNAKAEEVGVRWCIAQARELLEQGVPGIHFYVMNRSAHMKRIMAGIGR